MRPHTYELEWLDTALLVENDEVYEDANGSQHDSEVQSAENAHHDELASEEFLASSILRSAVYLESLELDIPDLAQSEAGVVVCHLLIII